MDKIIIECDCTAADTCPQGRIGSQNKCRIVRDQRVPPNITSIAPPADDPVLVTMKVLREEMESGRRGLIYRLDEQDKRLHSHDCRLAEDTAATDARLDRLSGIIDEHENRLKGLADELAFLAKHLGFQVADKGRAATKRIIKGGWVNFYPHGGCPAWHPTRQEADRGASPDRIACIHIADIIEGDGL